LKGDSHHVKRSDCCGDVRRRSGRGGSGGPQADARRGGKIDLGWEFKIVRANTSYFKKPENLRRVVEEEARSGWEMVEKFDDQRIRFKRRIEKRKEDQYRQDLDPYRTTVGIGQGKLALVILGSILLGTGIALAIVFGIIRPLVQ